MPFCYIEVGARFYYFLLCFPYSCFSKDLSRFALSAYFLITVLEIGIGIGIIYSAIIIYMLTKKYGGYIIV